MSNCKNRYFTVQRALALALALILTVCLLPGEPAAAADKKYGRINHDGVRFRRKAEATEVWAMLDTGWVLEIISEKKSGGVKYYYAVSNTPKHLDREYWGYISQEFMDVMTPEEVAAWEEAGGNAALAQAPAESTAVPGSAPTEAPVQATEAPAQPTAAPAVLTNYAQPTSASVNYYSYNGSALSSLGLLDPGSAYYVNGTADIAGTTYYIITIGETSCYVKADNMVMLTSGGTTEVPVTAPTQAPATATPAPGSAASAPAAQDGSTPIGTVIIKPAGTTNMRAEAHMKSGNIVAMIPQGTELPYYYTVTPPSGNHKWYYCYDAASGRFGYIVDDCVNVNNAIVIPTSAVNVPVQTNPPTDPPKTLPTAGPESPNRTVMGYIRIVPKGNTNIRKHPEVGNNNVVAQAAQGTLLPYYSASTVNKVTWYYVYYEPEQVFGYVIGTCAQVWDGDVTGTPTTAVPTSNTILGYVRFNAGGVNIRKTASSDAKVLSQVDSGTILPYYGIATAENKTWYYVRSTNAEGYVMGTFVQVINTEPAATAMPGTVTGAPAIVTATPAPAGPTILGYVMTTKDKVYIRKKATTDSGVYGQVAQAGTVLPIVGPTVSGSVRWYNVQFGENIGYIHGGFVAEMSQEQIYAYLNNQPMPTPTPTPTPAPKPVDYIRTIADKVWIRKSPSSSASTKGQAMLGAVFHFTGTVDVSGVKWYKIDYADGTYYIMAKYCQVMTDREYSDYIGTLPTPVVTATPAPEEMSNMAVTTMEKVIVRASGAPNGKQIALLYKANQVCVILGKTSTPDKNGKLWYNVTVNSTTGWIREDLLRVLTRTEAAMYEKTGDPSAKPEASYTTLQLGSTGDAVTRLQSRLYELGYLSAGGITGTYDSATRDAVRAYQNAAKLTIDGIATAAVQHSLFGTVETGYYDSQGSVGSVKLYKPELMDWYTSDIQSIFYKGCVAIVTDVKTGISFRVKRWSGGAHADVEPLTAADTAAMCRIYGVKIAQEISDKNLYQRHPVLVTIGTHSYAASMFGFPHNYPQGDTIPDNDFNGQFCIHFVNSRLHGGDSGSSTGVDSDHQKAIMYAYENAATLLNIK